MYVSGAMPIPTATLRKAHAVMVSCLAMAMRRHIQALDVPQGEPELGRLAQLMIDCDWGD